MTGYGSCGVSWFRWIPYTLWVEKFLAQNDQYLVAYEIDDKNRIVTFLDIGQHEHSYRDLEKYRKTAL